MTLRHPAVVVVACLGLLLGFAVCSNTAVSAEPGAPAMVASSEAPPVPDWLRKALKYVPAGVRDDSVAVDWLFINRSQDKGPWTSDDLALLTRFPNLKYLKIAGRFAPDALGQLKKLERLERASILSSLTDEDLKSFASLPGLKSLKLWEVARLTEAGMKYLSESKSLEEIDITAHVPDTTIVRPLGGMKGLKVLRLSVSQVTEAKMRAVAELIGPAVLDLQLGVPIKEKPADVLKPLRGMANVEGLRLKRWPLNSAAPDVIRTLKNLKRLDLKESKISDFQLDYLSGLANLRELDLALTRISDVGLASLRRLVALEKLDLTGARLTDAGRTVLVNLVNLRELNLANTPSSRFPNHKGVGDATLAVLGGLKNLERLNLSRNNVSIAGLAHLVDLKNLEGLDLRCCKKVNDQALLPVGRITSLRELNLDYTAVTEKGIRFLAGLKNLRKLTLCKCNVNKKITMDILKELKGLEVTFTGEGFNEYETLTVGSDAAKP